MTSLGENKVIYYPLPHTSIYETQWRHSVKTRLYKNPPPYFIVLASSVKTKEVEVIEFHRIRCRAKANGSSCVLRKYNVTAVCRIVIAVCALIKTMICFFSERSRSANVGLMLGQCNRRQDNIKYTLWSAWRFCECWRRTQSCWCHHRLWWCSRSSPVYCRLVTAVYQWKYVW